MKTLLEMRHWSFVSKNVVQVASHQGEELYLLLAAQGIEATVVRKTGSFFAYLEMDEDVNVEAVQAALTEWAQ